MLLDFFERHLHIKNTFLLRVSDEISVKYAMIFLCLSLLLLSGQFSSVKTVTALFIFFALLLSLLLKNLFTGFAVATIFSLPLTLPGKYYAVEAIAGANILEQAFREGLILYYGVGVRDAMIFLTSLLLIREVLLRPPKQFFSLYHVHIKSALISIACFSLFALTVSMYSSPFQSLSILWTIQYSYVGPVSMIALYLFYLGKNTQSFFMDSLFFSGIFQAVVSLWQFTKNGFIGLPFEAGVGTQFATGLDENNAFFRVYGTLVYHNQLALFLLLILLFLFGYYLKSRQLKKVGMLSFFVLVIALTQSRSIWIATVFSIITLAIVYRAEMVWLFNTQWAKRLMYYTALIFSVIFIAVIAPRLSISQNFFYKGGGGYIRIKLLEEGVAAFSRQPFFGYGVGTNQVVLFSLFPNGVMQLFPATIHFAPLQLLLEVGIIGSLLFISPFVLLLRRIVNSKSWSNDYSLSYLLGFLAFSVLYAFLPHNGTIDSTFLGLLLAFGIQSTSKEEML